MKTMLFAFSLVVVGLLVVSAPLLAHHGTAAYDLANSVTFQGTVTDFEFINPHAQLFFDVKDDKGNIEKWEGEITSPSQLTRGGGWTRESLKPGDKITVVGNRAKNGSYTMRVQKVTLADGTDLKIGGGDN